MNLIVGIILWKDVKNYLGAEILFKTKICREQQ